MKAPEEIEIEFRWKVPYGKGYDYPSPRSIIVRLHGGKVEEAIRKAREAFHLDDSWEVVNVKGAGI